MVPNREPKEAKLLTDAELELMNVLWRIEEGSVNDVMEGRSADRPAAYTTVSTILRILEQKGFVRSRKEGRGHVYSPAVDKADYESRTIKSMVERVFDGAPIALVRQLLQTERLSGDDLAELRRLIERLEEKR